LQAYRQASDYSYAFEIDTTDATRELEAVGAFVDKAGAAVDAVGG
jgi:hypothetical protein